MPAKKQDEELGSGPEVEAAIAEAPELLEPFRAPDYNPETYTANLLARISKTPGSSSAALTELRAGVELLESHLKTCV